ncbi:MAG: SIS domain-containing protein [Treponema sp.]|jgi:6-phospho-3-hexuloisomerase|nr:SIS domain-containing protein [Treponema sp.]
MEIFDAILKEIREVLVRINKEEMEAALALIKKPRRIFVDGEGRSGLMDKGFAMHLMRLGYTVYVVGETITPALWQDDVFIGVSGSGGSATVVNDAQKAKEIGCKTLIVTSKTDSVLAATADGLPYSF